MKVLNRNFLCWGRAMLGDSLLFVTTFLPKFLPPPSLTCDGFQSYLYKAGYYEGNKENNYIYMCVYLLFSHLHHWLTSQDKIILKKHF